MARRLTFALLFIVLAASARAQGRLAWDTTDHTFGSVEEGVDPTHVFTFVNDGDQPVTLSEVRASCGCTTPTYTSGEIAPGARGEVTVVYSSTGRPGTFDKSVFVRARGAQPEEYTLYIRGHVVPAVLDHGVTQGNVRFDADDYDAQTVEADAAVSHTFRMQNAGERPIRIHAARTFRSGFEVTYPDRPVFPGEVVEITVAAPAAGAAAAAGVLDLAVVLDTDDAIQPAKSLRVRGRVGTAPVDGRP
jgi:hypothetical protein